MAKVKAPRFSTPVVTLIKWPALIKPDFGTKDYPDKDGKYKTGAMASEEAFAPLIADLQKIYDEMLERAHQEFDALPVKTRKGFEAKGITGPVQNPFYSPIYDEETEEETGDIEMKFAKKYSGERKNPKPGQSKVWTSYPPKLFDAAGVEIDTKKKKIEIWSGTKAIITFEVKVDKDGNPGYFIPGTAACGLSLVPLAVQILQLAGGGGGKAEDYGFTRQEGFTSDELDEAVEDDDDVDSQTDDHDEGDDDEDF